VAVDADAERAIGVRECAVTTVFRAYEVYCVRRQSRARRAGGVGSGRRSSGRGGETEARRARSARRRQVYRSPGDEVSGARTSGAATVHTNSDSARDVLTAVCVP